MKMTQKRKEILAKIESLNSDWQFWEDMRAEKERIAKVYNEARKVFGRIKLFSHCEKAAFNIIAGGSFSTLAQQLKEFAKSITLKINQ
jgi:hypothetical protein